ncbi:MAG: phage DNA encapsidation protein [Clostridia bacterium]|nr:phage DNA encapsidation protein [Clostridia bacterium]
MSKIYTAEGWVNWEYLYSQTRLFCDVVGSRGTGKTYGLLKYAVENDLTFILLRRLQSQIQTIAGGSESNPFSKLNRDNDWTIQPIRKSGQTCFYSTETDEKGKIKATGRCLGYAMALSTVSTIRGGDWSNVDIIIFDEHIAMIGERPIKDEFNCFLHFVETVNRNRELLGQAPVKVFLLGNANQLCNPYYSGWGFMKTALKMIRGGQMLYRSKNGDRIMVLLLNSPISKRKKETALYQTENNDFIRNAIDNAFFTDATNIKSEKINGMSHIVSVGDIGIYRMKNGMYYVSETVQKNNYYNGQGIELTMVRKRYCLFPDLYLYGGIQFENYDTELLFRAYFNQE